MSKTTTKATKAAPAEPVERTFWDAEYPEGFTCRTCGETQVLSHFPAQTLWEDGSRTRKTECRACRDERLGAEGRGPKALARARREARRSS